MEIPADLPPDLVPIAWLVGRWEGAGVGGYPTIESFRFGQEIEFAHHGKPVLEYRSHTWLLDDDGNPKFHAISGSDEDTKDDQAKKDQIEKDKAWNDDLRKAAAEENKGEKR